MKRFALALRLSLLLVASGCGDTGQHSISVPLYGVGAAPEPFAAGDWTIRLDDARVGIGPIYFCAAQSSSADLCPSAVAELTDSVTIDALDPTPERLGTLAARTVSLGSAAWDFAITWPRTEAAPVVLNGAPEQHSAHFEGLASKDDQELHFVVDLDIVPLLRGTHTVQGVRTSASIEAGIECELHLDAAAWWSQVDFDDLASADTDPVIIQPGSRAYNALIVAMTSSAPPTVEWSEP